MLVFGPQKLPFPWAEFHLQLEVVPQLNGGGWRELLGVGRGRALGLQWPETQVRGVTRVWHGPQREEGRESRGCLHFLGLSVTCEGLRVCSTVQPTCEMTSEGLPAHICFCLSAASPHPPTQPSGRREIGDLAAGCRKGPFVLFGWKSLPCCSELSPRRGFVPLIDNEYQKGHIYIMSWVGIVCVPTVEKNSQK